jgi:hypothetical protein
VNVAMQNRAKIIAAKKATIYSSSVSFIDIWVLRVLFVLTKGWSLLYVDSEKYKKKLKSVFFNKVMTHFVKYDFMILATFREPNLWL